MGIGKVSVGAVKGLSSIHRIPARARLRSQRVSGGDRAQRERERRADGRALRLRGRCRGIRGAPSAPRIPLRCGFNRRPL